MDKVELRVRTNEGKCVREYSYRRETPSRTDLKPKRKNPLFEHLGKQEQEEPTQAQENPLLKRR